MSFRVKDEPGLILASGATGGQGPEKFRAPARQQKTPPGPGERLGRGGQAREVLELRGSYSEEPEDSRPSKAPKMPLTNAMTPSKRPSEVEDRAVKKVSMESMVVPFS